MTIKREIKNAILDLIGKYPILAVTGPRQSGKTTLLKTMFPDYQYISMENPDVRKFAESDPNKFFSQYQNKVILDEVQRVPALFSYMQTIVDNSNIMGQFILSGSQNFHLMRNITQSLAGRVAIFKLFPFDFQELKNENLLSDNFVDNIIKGFYPAIYSRDISPRIFYSNYIQTYIQRDVSELISIKDMHHFQKFLSLCATRCGQLLNLNSIANECGISQPTAKSWLSALENSYIVFLLYPYHENFSKRLIKTPKLYFYDTGLLSHLLKLNNASQILTHPIKGHLFENMMIAEYTKRMYHLNLVENIWFWRDGAGNEIDMITEKAFSLDAYEIKATTTIMPVLFKGLTKFETVIKNKTVDKSLVYGGNESQIRELGNVIPWSEFGKEISN